MGVMNHGRIAQVGSPTAIYEFPATKFVADFIGSVNMFEGKLVEDEPAYVRIRSSELSCTMYVDHGISSAPGATVWAAVRPEKIVISREAPAVESAGAGPAPGENVVRGVVKEVAYMGDMSVYLVQIESGKTVRVTRPNVIRHADDRIGSDESVFLSWHASSPVVLAQ